MKQPTLAMRAYPMRLTASPILLLVLSSTSPILYMLLLQDSSRPNPFLRDACHRGSLSKTMVRIRPFLFILSPTILTSSRRPNGDPQILSTTLAFPFLSLADSGNRPECICPDGEAIHFRRTSYGHTVQNYALC